jgi:hypothetical protein
MAGDHETVTAAAAVDSEAEVRSSSSRPKLRSKAGMSEPRYPSGKSVEVTVTLRAYRDQTAIVAVAEVLNQFRHGFTEGGVPEYATAFGEALSDLMEKHWPET